MAVRKILRAASGIEANPAGYPKANSIRVDPSTDTLVFGTGTSGTTEKTVVDTTSVQTLSNKNTPVNTYASDLAISVASQIALLTKGSAGAYTLAAPGAAGVGVMLEITAGSDFAHVVTFTGSTLKDGTTGAKITWTSAAFIGSSITVAAVTATQWVVISKNLGTVA